MHAMIDMYRNSTQDAAKIDSKLSSSGDLVDGDVSLNRRGKWKRHKCLKVFSAFILLFMRQLELKIVLQ